MELVAGVPARCLASFSAPADGIDENWLCQIERYLLGAMFSPFDRHGRQRGLSPKLVGRRSFGLALPTRDVRLLRHANRVELSQDPQIWTCDQCVNRDDLNFRP